jgi:conjugal transfer pilus assembly protein TraB
MSNDPNQKAKNTQNLIIGATITVIIVALGAGMLVFDGKPKKRDPSKAKAVDITPPGSSVDDKEAWRAQESSRMKSLEDNVDRLQDSLATIQKDGKARDDDIKAIRDAIEQGKLAAPTGKAAPSDTNVLETPLPGKLRNRISDTENTPPSASVQNSDKSTPTTRMVRPIANAEAATATPEAPSVEIISFTQDSNPKSRAGNGAQSASTKSEPAVEFIPAGSFVRATMLNGVDAPTGGQAQSNPAPITFHIIDLANLPSKYRLDIKDCRAVGAAWGDLSSERTLVRLETMSCIFRDGQTVEMKVKGHAIGEDGKYGIRGRLVTKQGQILANALLAGIASGMGDAFKQSSSIVNTGFGGTTSTIDPDKVGTAALGSGLSSAAKSLSDYYMKAADKLYPVIETDGGRIIELTFVKGVTYKGKADFNKQERTSLLERNGRRSITQGDSDE